MAIEFEFPWIEPAAARAVSAVTHHTLALSTNSTKLILRYNILVFSCVVGTRVLSCALEDEEASHYEMHTMFGSGDDGLASPTLDSVRSEQNILLI